MGFTNDIDCTSIPPHLALPELDEHSQALFGSGFMRVLKGAVQEVLDGSVEAVIVMLLVSCLDIYTNKSNQTLLKRKGAIF